MCANGQARPFDRRLGIDENNHGGLALVTNQPCPHSGDGDQDGDVDLDDVADFPGGVGGPWAAEGFVMPSPDCLHLFDLDAEDNVELKDLVGLQEVFAARGGTSRAQEHPALLGTLRVGVSS